MLITSALNLYIVFIYIVILLWILFAYVYVMLITSALNLYIVFIYIVILLWILNRIGEKHGRSDLCKPPRTRHLQCLVQRI